MNVYHQLIENPLFFKWIYHPSPEINTYWEHYLKEHPEEEKVIRDFKAGFEKHLGYKRNILSEDEKKELALKILHQLELNDRQNNRVSFFRRSLRYAAVALVFLVSGSMITYYILNRQNSKYFAQMSSSSGDINIAAPALIIDNEEKIALQPGESNLEYAADGQLTVDKHKLDGKVDKDKVKMNTLLIPYGNRSTVQLADGTKVWLNAGSRLIYPSRFVDKKREVFLVGEAFFEVAKNENHVFVVNTPDINVTVRGTKFNISAYPEENIIQTVLTEGKVELGWNNGNIFDLKTEMKPGQLVTSDKKEKITKIHDVNTEYFTSWREGHLTFQNSDLNRVMKKLERYYNISFRYSNPLDGQIKISGKLDMKSEQDQVFTYMSSLTGLSITKINDTYYEIN